MTHPPQPQPVYQQPPPTPKKNLDILVGIVLLILGIAVGLMIDNTNLISRVPFLSIVPTPTPLFSPSPTPDPTADWKTYTNETYGYSLQYPGWSLKEFPARGNVLQFMLLSSLGYTEILVRVENKENTCYQTDIKCYLPSEMEKITVNTLSAYQIDEFLPLDQTQKLRVVFFEKDGKMYSISQQRKMDNEQELLKTFNQILSTFKFTDQITTRYTCPPSGWVDCMPGPDPKPECSQAAMSWYKANCPNFQGGAL